MITDNSDPCRQEYQERRKKHWDAFALKKKSKHSWGNLYHRRLKEVYGLLDHPRMQSTRDRLWGGRPAGSPPSFLGRGD